MIASAEVSVISTRLQATFSPRACLPLSLVIRKESWKPGRGQLACGVLPPPLLVSPCPTAPAPGARVQCPASWALRTTPADQENRNSWLYSTPQTGALQHLAQSLTPAISYQTWHRAAPLSPPRSAPANHRHPDYSARDHASHPCFPIASFRPACQPGASRATPDHFPIQGRYRSHHQAANSSSPPTSRSPCHPTPDRSKNSRTKSHAPDVGDFQTSPPPHRQYHRRRCTPRPGPPH